MKYNTQKELLEICDKIANSTIKHYIEDYTKIDRPTLQNQLESGKKEAYIFIFRESGSYLLPKDRITQAGEKEPTALGYYRYYTESEPGTAKYYLLDTKAETITKLSEKKNLETLEAFTIEQRANTRREQEQEAEVIPFY